MDEQNQNEIKNVNEDKNENKDTSIVGWKVLSFFSPIIGFVLYVAWRNSQPANAKACGKYALIGLIIWIIWIIVEVFARFYLSIRL